MSEEVKQEAPRAKQYLLMVDESTVAFIGKLIPTLLFVEVEGINIKDNETHSFLVNPKAKPAPAPVESAPVESPKVD